jgi:hypothetical protein
VRALVGDPEAQGDLVQEGRIGQRGPDPGAEVVAGLEDQLVGAARNSAPASSGASARPSAFVVKAATRSRPPPGASRNSSARIPAAGMPRAVSRTWVDRPAVGKSAIEVTPLRA